MRGENADRAVAGAAIGVLGYVLLAAFVGAALDPFRAILLAGMLAAPLPLAARLAAPRLGSPASQHILLAAAHAAFAAAALAATACGAYALLYGRP